MAKENSQLKNMEDISENRIQDQIVLLPEIMTMILGLLDLRSLKKVRLVCKSWLLEAQAHVKRNGAVVRFRLAEGEDADDSFRTRLLKFMRLAQKRHPDLPQPFQSVELDVGKDYFPPEEVIVQLTKCLTAPPLPITKFTPGQLRLSLTLQILKQHSGSLEYLKLMLSYPGETEPLLDPEVTFPKLRFIHVDTRCFSSHMPIIFASLIAGIVRASPSLEAYESKRSEKSSSELGSRLLMEVDIRNLKTLLLYDYHLSPAALEHFFSLPFRQLENLRISLCPGFEYGPIPLDVGALTTTLAKCTATLKTLDLSEYQQPENLLEFPICPNVLKLSLVYFPYLNNCLSNTFPSLQVLHVRWLDLDVLGESWAALSPLLGLKSLRLNSVRLKRHEDNDSLAEQLPLRLFEKFPDLELVRLDYSFLMDCCRAKAGGHPDFSRILEGVKQLELCGDGVGWFEEAEERDLFASLTDIETLTLVKPSENLLLIPFKDMPALKVLQFPWGAHLKMTKLLEMARGLERVIVTNCCSFPRDVDPWSSEALDSFFDFAPNAKCGCKEWREMSDPFY